MDNLSIANFKQSGFEGERAVILPTPVAAMAARHPLLRGLRVTDAGYYPQAAWHQVERPHGAVGAVLILCREGCGWVRIGGTLRRSVGPGEAVLLAPQMPHAYGADPHDPWSIQWSHFEGTEIADWWRLLGLPEAGGILRLCAGIPEELDLGRVHERLNYDTASLLAAASALRWALANLRANHSGAPLEDSSLQALERVEKWMREHAAGKTSLAKLARMAGLSASHFSTLFRRRFGFPPLDYFLRLKIRLSCHLLDRTPWSVSRVANEVGMEDPLYFSRRFRAVMGESPRVYRNVSKLAVKEAPTSAQCGKEKITDLPVDAHTPGT